MKWRNLVNTEHPDLAVAEMGNAIQKFYFNYRFHGVVEYCTGDVENCIAHTE